MSRVYKCPICGKSYASLQDMYKCAQGCEAKEKEAERNKARETEAMRKAEKEINDLYEALKSKINAFNARYSSFSHYDITITKGIKKKASTNDDEEFLNKTLEGLKNVNPALNYTKTDLETFLKELVEDWGL